MLFRAVIRRFTVNTTLRGGYSTDATGMTSGWRAGSTRLGIGIALDKVKGCQSIDWNTGWSQARLCAAPTWGGLRGLVGFGRLQWLWGCSLLGLPTQHSEKEEKGDDDDGNGK